MTPLWWLGSIVDLRLMPGLPVSVLMAFCPLIAAVMLMFAAFYISALGERTGLVWLRCLPTSQAAA